MASYFSDFIFQTRIKESQPIKNITYTAEDVFAFSDEPISDEDIFAIESEPEDEFDIYEI